MCILPAPAAEHFSKLAQKIWDRHVKELYDSLSMGRKLDESRRKGKALDLKFYVTFRRGADSQSAQDLLDTVSRLRSRVSDSSAGGIHVDRRA